MTNIAYAIAHFFPPTYPFRGSVKKTKKNSKTVKYYFNLKQLFSMRIYNV